MSEILYIGCSGNTNHFSGVSRYILSEFVSDFDKSAIFRGTNHSDEAKYICKHKNNMYEQPTLDLAPLLVQWFRRSKSQQSNLLNSASFFKIK